MYAGEDFANILDEDILGNDAMFDDDPFLALEMTRKQQDTDIFESAPFAGAASTSTAHGSVLPSAMQEENQFAMPWGLSSMEDAAWDEAPTFAMTSPRHLRQQEISLGRRGESSPPSVKTEALATDFGGDPMWSSAVYIKGEDDSAMKDEPATHASIRADTLTSSSSLDSLNPASLPARAYVRRTSSASATSCNSLDSQLSSTLSIPTATVNRSRALSAEGKLMSTGGKKKGRRKSAPDLDVQSEPMLKSATIFKKEYHNRAERERTRRINSHIQELRETIGCTATDKVSILQNVVVAVTEVMARRSMPRQTVPRSEMSPLFDAMHLALAMVGADGRTMDCNVSLAACLGRTRAEIVGQQFEDFLHPMNLAVVADVRARLLRAAKGQGDGDSALSHVVSLRFNRKDFYLAANCRISIVLNEQNWPMCFSYMIDGKQSFVLNTN